MPKWFRRENFETATAAPGEQRELSQFVEQTLAEAGDKRTHCPECGSTWLHARRSSTDQGRILRLFCANGHVWQV